MQLIHLVLGGARSGKSGFAEKVAQTAFEQSQSVNKSLEKSSLTYLATATAGDDEMKARIAHHQQRRGPEWQLLEEPLNLAEVVDNASKQTTILIDCLTLWLSNCLHHGCWPEHRTNFLSSLENSSANIILVSNEVGSGIVPMGELSRQFVDESGWLQQQVAAIASDVTLVVAGLEMPLKRAGR
ncbi:MAG: adenosylcobinamide kinase/adenosylcobinamide-phosphate guanylyltransferase [Arenicella sp.]|jgi:adenosylcobinamide kinase/adenosylcobinamide-phosphate guanylyltransferase